MILKFKHKDCITKGATTWKFIDGIEEISTTPGIVKEDKVYPLVYTRNGDNTDIEEVPKEPEITDTEDICLSKNSDYVSIVYLYISTGAAVGLARVIAVQEAYLLNDHGETIEKI